MGLLDGLFGGGGGSADDPYADILTPAQRQQMTTQGLLAMAGAFADAGMPSRLPIPFGAALGKAAAALGTGSDAAMTSALAGAYRAQQIRDLRAKAALQAKLNPLFQQVLDQARGGGAPTQGGGQIALPGSALPARPGAPAAADGPLTLDQLPYPDTAGGGLLGGGDTDLTGGLPGNVPSGGGGRDTDLLTGGGLLSPAPATPAATNRQAYGVATPDELEAWIKSREAGGQDTFQAFVMKYRLRPRATDGSGGGLLGEGSGGGSSAADLGAGGDDATPVAGAPPWAADPLSRGLRGDTIGQNAMARFRQAVFGGGGAELDPYASLTPRSAGGAPARGETPEMTRLIEQAAAEQKISPDVLRGLIKTESGFNPNAVSPAGAVGLAQLMPGTARGLGVTDPTDPAQAIPAGARYLRAGLDAYGGDINKALMYYHGGPDQSMWGPRTQAYPGAVLAAAGRTTEGSGGSTEPDPYANLTPTRGVVPLAAPSTLPQLAPPGAAGAPGSSGKIPGLNMSPQELAVIDAMAESAGLGNPFKGLLDTYYKSPDYLRQKTETETRARTDIEDPINRRMKMLEFTLDMRKNGFFIGDQGQVVADPDYDKIVGRRAEDAEQLKLKYGKQLKTFEEQITIDQENRADKREAVTATVYGPNGQIVQQEMTRADKIKRLQNQSMNPGDYKPGDIVTKPLGNPPEGHEFRMTPQGALSAEPIAGTPAATAKAEVARKQSASDLNLQVSRDIMVQNANRIEDLVQNSTLPVTGAGSLLSRLPGSDANDVRALVETMKARSSLDALNTMRQASPTGAALGNVSNAEGDRLAAALSNLDQSQSKDQFLFNLRRAKQSYVDAVHGPGAYSKLSDESVLKVPPAGNPTRQWKEGDIVSYPDGSRQVVRDGQWMRIPAPGR